MIKNLLNRNKNGFTLIELLVVISILGVLAVLVISNVNEARVRARDVRKKEDMAQLRTALKLYYNDYTVYPLSSTSCSGLYNVPKGCGSTGTSCCPNTTANCPQFSAGGTSGCDTVYMSKLPAGLGSNVIGYFSSTDGENFCLKTTLENASDPDTAASYQGCSATCAKTTANLKSTEYAVCSD